MLKKIKNFNFSSRSGMTLTEMLIGIAISATIMIATITMVNYCFSAYATTQSQIANDSGLYDTTDIINRYIREAEFCSVKEGSTLYISINDYSAIGTTFSSDDVRFIYDAAKQTLLLDKMDGTKALVIANHITSVKWEVYNNGVRYQLEQKLPTSNETDFVNGYAYCRGR